MSEFYSEVPGEYPASLPPLAPGEVRGDCWSVKPIDGKYMLDFISGGHGGRYIFIAVTAEEYAALADGSASWVDVAAKYGVG